MGVARRCIDIDRAVYATDLATPDVNGTDTGQLEAVLYSAAAVAGGIAIVFFGFNVRFPISPVTKFAVLAVIGLWLVVVGQFAGTRAGIVASYVLGVVSWGTGGMQLVGLLSLGSAGVVALLAAVASLFAGLARWVRVGNLQPLHENTRANAVLAGGGAAAVVALILFDILTGGVAISLTTLDTAQQPGAVDEPVVRVGTFETTNTGVLPYGVEPPQYEACLAGNWSAVTSERRGAARIVGIDGSLSGEALARGERTTTDLRVVAPRYAEGRRAALTGVPVVETDSCPAATEGARRIAVYRTAAGGIRPV